MAFVVGIGVVIAGTACVYDGDLDAVSCVTESQCEEGSSCVDGYCVAEEIEEPVCPGATESECDGECVDVETDENHCGGCGIECSTEVEDGVPACVDGNCSFACVDGLEACDGECVATDDSLEHCGGCGNECTTADSHAAPSCEDGVCSFVCLGDRVDCGGECVDIEINDDHCGGCDQSCEVGQGCVEETCVDIPCDPQMRPFGGGQGSTDDPFTICDVAHLQNIHPAGEDSDQYLASHFQLYGDIDLAGRSLAPIGLGGDWDFEQSIFSEKFEGVFDGGGFAIENYRVNSSLIATGLFGVIGEGGVVRNLQVVDVDVLGDRWVGGLAAVNEGTIEDVAVSGTVVGEQTVGGLVGRHNGVIDASWSSAQVEGSHARVGGLVGNQIGGLIVDAEAAGDVVADGDVNFVGGLVGDGNGEIRRCLATGDVDAPLAQGVGGLVGQVDRMGLVVDTYATGGVDGDERVGGLIGSIATAGGPGSGELQTSYSTGSVSGANHVGGLVGQSQGTVVDSYWNLTTSGLEESDGGAAIEGEDFSELSSFSGFDFDEVWQMSEEGPRLQWEE